MKQEVGHTQMWSFIYGGIKKYSADDPDDVESKLPFYVHSLIFLLSCYVMTQYHSVKYYSYGPPDGKYVIVGSNKDRYKSVDNDKVISTYRFTMVNEDGGKVDMNVGSYSYGRFDVGDTVEFEYGKLK